MALIKFGMMMSDARGKLGGQVFTKTRSGATVRTKVTPTNPQTAAQQNARAILGNLSASWRTLSEEQRNGWISAVDGFTRTNIFGDTYNPSGKNLFVGLNSNLATVGKPVIETPPVPVELPSYVLESVAISGNTEEIELGFSGTIPNLHFSVVYQASKPSSAGRNNFSGQYATFHSVSTGTAPTPAVLWTAYVAKFGMPTDGAKIAIKTFVLSNTSGQKSVESVGTAIVVS